MPRIVIISDTHEKHGLIKVPEGDILIHCGDYSGSGSIAATSLFNSYLGTQPHTHKIFIAGNHDFLFERDNTLARSMITNAIYLQDEMVEVMGLKIYGAPWQPEFYDWAFNVPRGPDIKRKWDLIPKGLEILITHGPPAGILDAVRPWSKTNPDHVGCADLLEAVKWAKPKVHCFGHIHESHGQLEKDGTIFVNAAVLDDRYKPAFDPIVIDL